MASTHDYVKDIRNEDIKIYINGEYHHRSEAKISVFDSGFLLGDGVWEGIRLHNNKLIHLEHHIDRLYDGAKAIEMDIGLSKNEMGIAIQNTIERNDMNSGVHIRLIVSRGIKSTPYQHPKVTVSAPTIVIIPEYKEANKNVSIHGIKLGTVNTIRDNRIQDPRINSLSKHNCIAACIEAEKMGVDEGLMFDPYGNIATCNSTNFFIIRNNEVWTSTGEHCLNGVTRQIVIELCQQKKITVFEKNFKLKDVHDADEVFVTGTFAGIIPVVSVDGIIIGNGERGLLTLKLQNWYELNLPSAKDT